MSWKKNVFSYLVWIFYMLFTGLTVYGLVRQLGTESLLAVLASAFVFAAAGALVFLLYAFGPKISAESSDRNAVRNVSEAALAVVLLAVGLVLRVRSIEGAGQINAYFEMAQVSAGTKIPQVAHGASYLYLQLLHLVFYFLGNKFIAGIWLQIVLQLAACAALYCGLRRLTGHLAALVTLGFMMCSPAMIGYALLLSPEMLDLFLFGLALCIIVSAKNKGRIPAAEFFCGLLGGAVTYLDVGGLFLVLLAALGAFAMRKKKLTAGRRLLALLSSVAGALAGFFACIAADAFFSKKEFIGVLSTWYELYRPKRAALPEALLPVNVTFEEAAVLAVLLCIGVFSFWCSARRDSLSLFTIGACLVTAAEVFHIFTEEMSGELPLYLFLISLAGIGIEECFRADAEPVCETTSKEEKALEDTGESKREPGAEDADTPKKTTYIENPLPLPKKHEKRVLDYDHPLKPGEEKFDVAVAEDDDFDLS